MSLTSLKRGPKWEGGKDERASKVATFSASYPVFDFLAAGRPTALRSIPTSVRTRLGCHAEIARAPWV
jgi:hypothetical protein